MQIHATQKTIHITPRKLRLVANAVKHQEPETALATLEAINTRASQALAKVVRQALANATNNHSLNTSQLKFSSIQINQGITYKRWQPVSRGRAHPIKKTTSHIKVSLTSATSKPTPTPTSRPHPKPQTKASTQTTSTSKAKTTTKTKTKKTKSTTADQTTK